MGYITIMTHYCLRSHLLQQQDRPVVFQGKISDWPASQWFPENLPSIFGPEFPVQLRLAPRTQVDDILWEHNCVYEEVTIQEFCEWLAGGVTEQNRLQKYPPEDFWGYFDYKHLGAMFAEDAQILEAVDWSPFGFERRGGKESTLWIGSPSAHTPCHQDSYGCNLVAQIYGRKRWVLFPPSDSPCLYPTRVPYEESSVFSSVNLLSCNMKMWPKLKLSHPHIVTLEPGQVLFVPPKWWHFVQCLDTAISINTWIEIESDRDSRLEEAMTRLLVTSLMSQSQIPLDDWLNPTEELTDQATNVTYIQTALDKARKWSTGGAPTASHRHLCCHGNQKDTPSESICCSSLETNARTPSPDMQNSCDIKCSSHRKQNSSSNTNVESPKRTDGLVICSCSCTHDQLCSVKNCAVAPSTTVNELMLMFHKDCDDGCNICTNTTSGEKEQGLKRTGSDCDTSACKIIRLNHDKDPDILHLDHDNKSSCKLGQNIEHTDPHDQESTGCLPLAIEPPSDGKLCESSLSTVVPKVTSHDSKSTSSDEVSIDSIVNAFCDSRVIKLVCDIMKENV